MGAALEGSSEHLAQTEGEKANSKCKFARKDLGHHIGEGTIKPQQAKVVALLEKERPRSCSPTWDLLVTIGGYSTIAAPLTELTRKKQPDQLHWKEVHQKAFEELRQRLSSAPVLIAPDHNLPFILSTDASGVGIGAILEQEW